MPGDLYQRLHERRADFEKAVLARFPDDFGPQDAEDVVSAAMDRVLKASRLPARTREDEERWFRSIITSAGIDEIRRRRGRGHSRYSSGALRRTVLLSELAEQGVELPGAEELDTPDAWVEEADQAQHRERVIALARGAVDQLADDDLRLLVIRHVECPNATRNECAEAAGLTLEAWRWRYARAWKRFVESVAATEPTPRCRRIRNLIGVLDAGGLGDDARSSRARVDVHIVECPACRVFARDSYRILSLVPTAPAAGGAAACWSERGAEVLDRNGAEVATAAGATAGGAGLIGLLSAAGLGGGAKLVAVVCGISVVTAGLCGGVVATMEWLDRPTPNEQRATTGPAMVRPAVDRSARPTPTAVATRPVRQVVRTESRSPSKPTAKTPAKSSPPAAAPGGSSGNEFDPVPANAASQPAPVPVGVSGEFAP